MRSLVITGGTDGMGRALALTYLGRGDEVVIVGRDGEKGAAVLEAAAAMGAADRAHFVRADLSLVSENRRVIDEVRRVLSTVDALILCARHYRSTRAVTAEGFEDNFALFYLSRFVLGYGLVDLLDAAERPVILNVSGPGSGTSDVAWDDLQCERDYRGMDALMRGGPLNDLLGLGFVQNEASAKVRYVLLHPGTVSTSFSGEYDEQTQLVIDHLKDTARPIEEALAPMLEVLDHPPAAGLSAVVLGEALDVRGPAFDADAARRLYGETTVLLSRLASAAPGVSMSRLRRLLDRPVFATVATVHPDGGPHQSVVWVTRDGDDVLFVVAVGSRKERNLRRSPDVSVLVSPPEEPYTYAAIRGTATLSDEGATELRDALAIKYTGKAYADHNPEAVGRTRDTAITTVRVSPTRVVGRL
ncbi:TIGR03618 family F420-dependent PPOX class oxidoreductase [Pseudonocardia spinosispora]|uniref:TIGR03618 family F420-dependent PPOX class oxidoreductase n=1 Tax=Pseudonocardia spinosispora TaxID=103441 RepID=UPI0004276FF4|nr:TIGR03618 family F420-dependent PPOX class oxidoreductase [Pseudonocardia spinosispora]